MYFYIHQVIVILCYIYVTVCVKEPRLENEIIYKENTNNTSIEFIEQNVFNTISPIHDKKNNNFSSELNTTRYNVSSFISNNPFIQISSTKIRNLEEKDNSHELANTSLDESKYNESVTMAATEKKNSSSGIDPVAVTVKNISGSSIKPISTTEKNILSSDIDPMVAAEKSVSSSDTHLTTNTENKFSSSELDVPYANVKQMANDEKSLSRSSLNPIATTESNYKSTLTNVNTSAIKTENIDCSDKKCYSKCCPIGEMYSFIHLTCVESPKRYQSWTPTFLHPNGVEIFDSRPIVPIYQRPKCEFYGPKDPGRLFASGEYSVPTLDTTFQMDKYCIDLFHAPAGNIANYELPSGLEYDVSNMICFEALQPTSYDRIRKYLHPITLMISCISLAFVIFCYSTLDELRTVHGSQGLLLISHSCSLLIGNFFVFLINVLSDESLGHEFCIICAIVIHYSFLAAFFWLNLMCFDMWKIIRASFMFQRMDNQKTNSSVKKTLLYTLYGWGVPFIIVSISMIMNFLPNTIIPWYIITPQYGVGQCWMPRKKEILFTYFYGIVAALFFANMILLTQSFWLFLNYKTDFTNKIRKLMNLEIKGPNMTIQNISRSKDQMTMFLHRFMIFALLAICWIFEVVSLLSGPREAWAFTDLLNTLQGFFLFMIFIFNKRKREVITSKLSEFLQSSLKAQRRISNTSSTNISNYISSVKKQFVRRISREDQSKTSCENDENTSQMPQPRNINESKKDIAEISI